MLPRPNFRTSSGQVKYLGGVILFLQKKTDVQKELIGYFLPKGLPEYFTINKVEELEEISTKRMVVQIELEEINTIPKGYDSSLYESKGFVQ